MTDFPLNTKISYLLSLGAEGASIFCEAWCNPDTMDNDEVMGEIFALYTSSTVNSDMIFQNSIQHLMRSETMDFMVYKLRDNNRKYCDGIDSWPIELEINEANYDRLMANLSLKVRNFHNKHRKKR
ncbi:MAG: hypothetical protein AAGH81_19040, partial [Bacteroidota bacterium]